MQRQDPYSGELLTACSPPFLVESGFGIRVIASLGFRFEAVKVSGAGFRTPGYRVPIAEGCAVGPGVVHISIIVGDYSIWSICEFAMISRLHSAEAYKHTLIH